MPSAGSSGVADARVIQRSPVAAAFAGRGMHRRQVGERTPDVDGDPCSPRQ